MRKHNLYDGKYQVYHENGILTATRYNEPWEAGDKALIGDGLSLAMIQRIEELEDALQNAMHKLNSGNKVYAYNIGIDMGRGGDNEQN